MRRLFGIAASVALLFVLFVPAALAAEPATTTGSVILSANGTVDIPAGRAVETVVVIDGTATIAGNVATLVVVGGSALLDGATVESIFVTGGSVDIGAGTTVTGDVRTLDASVTQQPGSAVLGSVDALDGDLAALAILLIPVFIVLAVGFAVAAVVVGLLVAAFSARQVRSVEALIERQPGQVLVAGVLGAILLPALALLLIVTVIGAPIGFGLLFVALPALAFLGWIVAAIWVGDWIVGRMRGQREPGRPYLAAVLGVAILGVAGILPFVSTIATLFGFGGLLLAGWRTLRPEAPAVNSAGTPAPAPVAG